ncbi:MAG: RagB/SusD family nutrient uptake outer membrane protein [Tannerellaceae bacterium]
MKKTGILILGGIAMLHTSCGDLLDPYPYGSFPEEELWKYPNLVQGFVGKAYDYMPKTYNDNDGYYLDGATDDAVITSTTHVMQRLGTGAITTNNDPFEVYWANDYQAIGSVNRFLKDNRGFNTRFKTNARQDSLTRYRLQGEAYALRAWFHWDLIQKFGGKGLNGELLGVPLMTEPVDDAYNTTMNWARNTYSECIAQIQADCDSAYRYLPIAHRDFLMEQSTDKGCAGSMFWGCMDGITTRAILAQMYLTYASPLFNPDNDLSRWEKAATYAKEVIDFKLNVDNVKNGFDAKKGVEWTNPNFAGIVFASRFKTGNDEMERALYPAGFSGNGAIGASQELVDAFPMKNGYPKEHPEGAKLYDPQNPYTNRDPRFYSVIFYNGATANRDNNASKPMYTFESWYTPEHTVGKDIAGNQNTSRTNYHIKKFIYMGLNWTDASVKRTNHSKFFIRWAHMLLTFAEAANEVAGPNGVVSGMSAKEAMQYLRSRRTYDNAELYAKADPYLDEVAAQGKDAFRAFIRNERRIETCFEGMRFYDLRRWSTEKDLSLLNSTLTKPMILKQEDGTFEYTYGETIEKRSFPSVYLPIPYKEILRMDQLVQNLGWENWQ